MKNQLSFAAAAALLLLSACAITPPPGRVLPEKPAASVPSEGASPSVVLKPDHWNAVTGWADDDIQPAWDAFLRSCTVLKNQPLWQETCTQATIFKGEMAMYYGNFSRAVLFLTKC